MPLFAWMHYYAFPWTDYQDKRLSSRMQVIYALRDCLGNQDILWDTRHAFPTFSSFFWSTPIFLPEDDHESLEPLRGTRPGLYVLESSSDSNSLHFEIDGQEDNEYDQARNLVFGDFHFPVIHDDWRHPPTVQRIINRNASDFYAGVAAASREGTTTDNAVARELN